MAKSPVYGRGRNRNHKPRGSLNHPAAANINMRGKKSMVDKCWCCVCIDMRDKVLLKLHREEIYNYGDESQ